MCVFGNMDILLPFSVTDKNGKFICSTSADILIITDTAWQKQNIRTRIYLSKWIRALGRERLRVHGK